MAASNSTKVLSSSQIEERLSSILINASEGRRSVSDDSQYTILRKELLRRIDNPAELVETHPTVDSFVAHIKGIPDKPTRVEKVRESFAETRSNTATADRSSNSKDIDPSAWTGAQSRTQRLTVIKQVLPLAQASIESMIATLSEPGPNGGPLLDSREEAIEHLRSLHKALGEVLAAIDADRFNDELGGELAADAARFAKKAARSLRDDPIPYISSAMLLAVLSACGLPGLGGYLSGIALNIRKSIKD